MKTVLRHGATLETLTLPEAKAMLRAIRLRAEPVRVRGGGNGATAASGIPVTFDVFKVPVGYEFALRRLFIEMDETSDPNSGALNLTAAGNIIEYLRSGTRIEYGVPLGPAGTAQVPGVQSWGEQQGPYLVNGEVLQVRATTVPSSRSFRVAVEGILRQIRVI